MSGCPCVEDANGKRWEEISPGVWWDGAAVGTPVAPTKPCSPPGGGGSSSSLADFGGNALTPEPSGDICVTPGTQTCDQGTGSDRPVVKGDVLVTEANRPKDFGDDGGVLLGSAPAAVSGVGPGPYVYGDVSSPIVSIDVTNPDLCRPARAIFDIRMNAGASAPSGVPNWWGSPRTSFDNGSGTLTLIQTGDAVSHAGYVGHPTPGVSMVNSWERNRQMTSVLIPPGGTITARAQITFQTVGMQAASSTFRGLTRFWVVEVRSESP